jgi:hypothetical protein
LLEKQVLQDSSRLRWLTSGQAGILFISFEDVLGSPVKKRSPFMPEVGDGTDKSKGRIVKEYTTKI